MAGIGSMAGPRPHFFGRTSSIPMHTEVTRPVSQMVHALVPLKILTIIIIITIKSLYSVHSYAGSSKGSIVLPSRHIAATQ